MSGSSVGGQNGAHTTTGLPRCSQHLGKPAILHATTTFFTNNLPGNPNLYSSNSTAYLAYT